MSVRTGHLAVVAAGLALIAACGFQATLELDLSFQPLGGAALDCDAAGVDTVVVSVFENLDDAPQSVVTRSCRAWRRQQLLVAPGTLSLRAQGLNADGAVCFEDTREVTFGRRDEHTVEWVVIQHDDGLANGCIYP